MVGARVRPGLIFRFCLPRRGAGPGDEPGPERGGNHQRKSVRLGRDNMKTKEINKRSADRAAALAGAEAAEAAIYPE